MQFKEPKGKGAHDSWPGMFWPDLWLMEQASKKRQLSASQKVDYGPVAIRVVKPWVSHLKLLDAIVSSIIFPPEIRTSIGRFPLTKEVFKEMLAYRAT